MKLTNLYNKLHFYVMPVISKSCLYALNRNDVRFKCFFFLATYIQLRHGAHRQKAPCLPFKMRSICSKYILRRPSIGGNNRSIIRQRDRFGLAYCHHDSSDAHHWLDLRGLDLGPIPLGRVYLRVDIFFSISCVFSCKIYNMPLPSKKQSHSLKKAAISMCSEGKSEKT